MPKRDHRKLKRSKAAQQNRERQQRWIENNGPLAIEIRRNRLKAWKAARKVVELTERLQRQREEKRKKEGAEVTEERK